MKKYFKYGLLAVSLLLVLFYCLVGGSKLSPRSQPSEISSKLVHSINNCQGIAAKSVAHLNAILEFQKLEIEGRKMHVFQQCMNDQGYMENPEWVKFAEPISQKEAETSGVSLNEAYEKFRRTQMVLIKVPHHHPLYWKISRESK
ncbi:hypothetical protein [Methylotenera sp.]|uniref:hypothetical protein n=1 Tax=Methylotenera sp. TaxID=2051956 RepID=UPI002734B32B|nr:hypothetical protein [Methylotenera sp.]MDP3776190.1 hypothetical protein [Methylotenera sp.]